MEVEHVENKDRKTYMETMIFFMVFVLTITVVVITGTGFAIPLSDSSNGLTPIFGNMLLFLIVAELMTIILLLQRISQK